MKRYHIIFCILLFLICSCTHQKQLNRRISLWRLDDIPYGTKYAYENLPSIFPNAHIRNNKNFPVFPDDEHSGDTLRSIIIISPRFNPRPSEMNDLISYASAGSQVLIAAGQFGDTVMDMLKVKWRMSAYQEDDSTKEFILNPSSGHWQAFDYPGYGSDKYFDNGDTTHITIIGKDANRRPNFIRIGYPHGGAIFIHLNPFVFSNFFLLHGKNKVYYDLALSWLPARTRVVEWVDYFRYVHNPENFSALRFILKNTSLRWAFWLTLTSFALLFLFESKRKQRLIPVIPEIRNASQDFVRTVGRLYFQQKNNQNLAAKMVSSFLENIRSAYNLPTSVLDDEFTKKLSFRSGKPIREVEELLVSIHHSRTNADLSDQELMHLHYQINQINKPAT